MILFLWIKTKKLNQILYFGTIIRKKGVLELANIFNEVHSQRPETELLLLGKDVVDVFENRSTKELFKKRLTNTALKNVFFENEVPYSEVQSIIANSAVVVLPSFAEALPMTWLEAMAMEKAIVTSDVGWASEVMERWRNRLYCRSKISFGIRKENHSIARE